MPTTDKDGWTNWAGGKCPVPAGAPVFVNTSDGCTVEPAPAGTFRWTHIGDDTDITGYRLADSLHAPPEPDGFTHESPIRAFTDWTVNGRYAIGKGFRPSLGHLTVYLDAMDRLEGWALLQILEAASGSPSFVFRRSDSREALDILAELSAILNDDERVYVQEILTRAHHLIEGNRP